MRTPFAAHARALLSSALLPLLALSLLASPRAAHADDCEAVWEVASLVRPGAQRVHLKRGDRIAAILPQDWLRRILAIKADIDRASMRDTRLYLCDSYRRNAFAAEVDGQGIVMMTLGMYNLIEEDWDAYAALLGHENAHLVKRHGAQRRDRAVGLSLTQLLLGATVDGIDPRVIELGAGAFAAVYSRAEEREADLCGMVYAQRAGYDPDGALRLHRLLDSSGSGFLASHPSSADRIAALRKGLAWQSAAREARCAP